MFTERAVVFQMSCGCGCLRKHFLRILVLSYKRRCGTSRTQQDNLSRRNVYCELDGFSVSVCVAVCIPGQSADAI